MNVEVKDEFRLESILNSLKVDQLKNIRRNLDLKNMSSLRKGELVVALAEKIPQSVENKAQLLDVDQYSAILRLMSKSGVVEMEALDIEDIFYLSSIGYTHPAKVEDQEVLVMPQEIMKEFYQLDTMQMKALVNRNQKITNLLFAAMKYYGVIRINDAKVMFEKYIGEEIDSQWFNQYIMHLENYYGSFRISKDYIVNELVGDEEQLIARQDEKEGLGYYPIPQSDMFRMQRTEIWNRTPEMTELFKVMEKYYDMSEEQMNDIIGQCILMAQMEESLNAIVSFVGEHVQFSKQKEAMEFVSKLINLLNNSRLWILKGFTPTELSPAKEETETEPATSVQQVKVGRNEPCPCESGKKYKKCCGK